MLKTTKLPNMLQPKVRNSNSEVIKFGISNSDEKLSKKLKKLSKSQKLSKNRNLPKFGTKKTEPNFLTSNTRETFNRLRLAFTKALILQYFDSKCHISVVTNV